MTSLRRWQNRIPSIEWISLIALFLLAGSIGHDPWKLHEPYVFGIIYHFFTTHSWVIPVNAGVPFMEKPPLYHWTAALFCHLLGGILPLHDAARMASVFYTVLTALFMWKTSQVLFATRSECKSLGYISIALLLGQIGIANDIHLMRTDVSLLTGTTMTLYGMAMLGHMQENWGKAGIWMGLGFGVSFMSKGLFIPITLILGGIMLWHILPMLRTQNTRRALRIAFWVALPFVTLWPALVWLDSPALFIEWFWDNNVGRFLGFSVARLGSANDRHSLLFSLLKNSFPALPLVCQIIIVEKWRNRTMEYMLPLCIMTSGLLLLILSATGNGCYFLPLLPTFALLAAPVMLRLPEQFLIYWNFWIRILTSMTAAVIWLIWWNLRYPPEAKIFKLWMHYAGNWLPLDFAPPEQTFACLAALCAALFWLASFRLSPRSALNTAYIWLSSISLLWVTMALMFPWQNAKISYRSALMEMVGVVRQFPGEHNCVQAGNYDEIVSPMFYYIAEPLLPPRKNGEACPFLFLSSTGAIPKDVELHWHMIWTGARYNKEDEIRLYQINQPVL